MRSRDAAGYGLLLVATTSCLVLGDFQDLEPEGATSSGSATTGVTGTTASSSADATSASSGGGGAGSSGTGGGSQSSTGGGGSGGGFTNPLGDHGNVGVVATTAEGCEVEITDWVELGEFTYLGGVTRPDNPTGTCGTVAGSLLDFGTEGEATSWLVQLDANLFIVQTAVLGQSLPARASAATVQLATNGSLVFAAFDDSARRLPSGPSTTVQNVTDPLDLGGIHVLRGADLQVHDLISIGARVHAVGTIDGEASTGPLEGCGATAVGYGTYDHAGFVWSFDSGGCSLGTYGANTQVSAAIAEPLLLTARGSLDFGAGSECGELPDTPTTLSVFDASNLPAAAFPGACSQRTVLGTGTPQPVRIAARGSIQILAYEESVGSPFLVTRDVRGRTQDPRAFGGQARVRSVFVGPAGRPGAAGAFEGSISYGNLSARSEDTGAFFVTFDGGSGFVLDGAGPDRLTATLASSDRVYVAGQWESQLPELGLVGEQLDPFGIAAFYTFIPID